MSKIGVVFIRALYVMSLFMVALWEPKLDWWDILLTVHNSVHLCMWLWGVHCTACHEREYSCTVRQSSGVSFNHFMSSLLLNIKCQEESLRADNSLPCLRVITAFTTQSNLPDLSFFCPTLITSLQGFYDHFLSYNSPLCFAGNSNEFKYLQAVVSRSRTNILYFAWIMLWEKVRK